jgi:hypothetical protein
MSVSVVCRKTNITDDNDKNDEFIFTGRRQNSHPESGTMGIKITPL